MLTVSETAESSFTRVHGQRYEEQHQDLHENPKEDETTISRVRWGGRKMLLPLNDA